MSESQNFWTAQDRSDFNRLKQDMWHGNGKPAVTVRMQAAESRIDQAEKDAKIMKMEIGSLQRTNQKLHEKANSNSTKILIGILFILLTLLADIFKRHI